MKESSLKPISITRLVMRDKVDKLLKKKEKFKNLVGLGLTMNMITEEDYSQLIKYLKLK